ncbi:MAG: glycerol-3-phosphate 1-O-acyltransferase PlsY [Holophagales bacterium]|nr:glycerol-3-phosphate 1-O-acyltransferase PlsY [Holophagales bacterium]
MLELGVKFLLSYFLGSIMGSIVIGSLRGGVDIRTMGSGNAGGTNALRTQGWQFALGVVIIDIGKGALAAGAVPLLALPLVPEDPALPRAVLTVFCAAAAVLGHVWPMWHRFRGGKGAATLVGTMTVLAPFLLIPVLVVWLLFLTVFGYVGLATILAALSAPVYLARIGVPLTQPLFLYAVFCALFMVYTHRSNIQRMREGSEPKNTKLMIFRRGRSG